jgi:hypothetical protein
LQVGDLWQQHAKQHSQCASMSELAAGLPYKAIRNDQNAAIGQGGHPWANAGFDDIVPLIGGPAIQ